MEEREISLKELIDVVWGGKILIGILTIVFAIVALAGGMILDTTTSTVSTVITLQWDGATAGEYPDGTRFDYNEMIQTYNIESAADAAGVAYISTDVLRNSIKITPIIPTSVISVIQTALEEGEQITYFATDYKISFDNGSLNLNVGEGKEFLVGLIDEFRADFERKYIMQSIVLDYTSTDITTYDYLDAYLILDAQTGLIEDAMETRNALDPGFVSSQNVSFSDILVRTALLRQIELDQIVSRSNTYLLTKDADYLITKYTYANVINQLELDKNTAKEVTAQLLVDGFAGSKTTILIPGLDSSEALEIDSYYDTLLINLIGIQNSIADLTLDIAFNEIRIANLENLDSLTLSEQEKYDSEISLVESKILLTSVELGELVEDSNILLTEYNEYTVSNVIKPLMTPQYESTVNAKLYALVGLVLGGGLGTVVVLFKHDWE